MDQRRFFFVLLVAVFVLSVFIGTFEAGRSTGAALLAK